MDGRYGRLLSHLIYGTFLIASLSASISPTSLKASPLPYKVGPTGIAIGSVATTQSICSILRHPFFSLQRSEKTQLGLINGIANWDSNGIAHQWLRNLISNKRASSYGGAYDSVHPTIETASIAEKNVTDCLRSLGQGNAPFTFLLPYLRDTGLPCYQTKAPNTSPWLPTKPSSCLNWSYDGGRITSPPSSSAFITLLTLTEGHAVLRTTLDSARERIDQLIAKRNDDTRRQRETEEKAAEQRNQENKNRKFAEDKAKEDAKRLGQEFAAASQQTWNTSDDPDLMTERKYIKAASRQANQSGLVAQVVASCQNDDRVGSGSLPTFTVSIHAPRTAEYQPTFGDVTFESGHRRVKTQIRINNEEPKVVALLNDRYRNEILLFQLNPRTLSPTHISELWGQEMLWGVRALLQTSHGSLIVEIPLFSPALMSVTKSCTNTTK